MKLNLAMILLMMMGTITSIEYKTEDGLFYPELTDLDEFIKDHPLVLIFLHGKECDHCGLIKHTWRKLMTDWKDTYPQMKFALMNADGDEDLKMKNDIQGLPQMRLYFEGGFFAFFDDEFNEANLKNFADFHLQTNARPLLIDSDRSYVRFSNRANAILLSFPETGATEAEFALGLQKVVPDIPVYYTQSESKYAMMSFPSDHSQSTHKMKMKRNFDEGDKFLGTRDKFLPRHILQLVWPYRKSRIEVFSSRTIKDVLNLKKSAVFFFDEEYDGEKAEVFSKAVLSKPFDALAIKSKLDEEGVDKIRGLFGVRRADFPTVRAVRWEKERALKYALEGEFSKESFELFLDDFEAKKLIPYRKNQKVENSPDATVLTMNRDLYINQVQDKSTHFVCALVGKESSVLEEILRNAHTLLKNPKNFVFGIIDVNLNEIEGFDRKKIPYVQIMTKTQRNRPLRYDGELNYKSFADYLNQSIDGSDEL